VFVELEATPWVWRVADDGAVTAHTGVPIQVQQALLDEAGWLYLLTDLGLGLVHTQDMGRAAQVLEQGLWPLQEAPGADLPQRFAYVPSPQAQHRKDAI
jgi:hypothetical protein